MRIAQSETAIKSFHAHKAKGRDAKECAKILGHIITNGGQWSRGEIAKALGIDKSTISARVFELIHKKHMLVEYPQRKDKVSGIRITPVGLPVSQQDLFNIVITVN